MKKIILLLAFIVASSASYGAIWMDRADQVSVISSNLVTFPPATSTVQSALEAIGLRAITTNSLAGYMYGTNLNGATYAASNNTWYIQPPTNTLPGTNILGATYYNSVWSISTISNAVWVPVEGTNFTANLVNQMLVLGYPPNSLQTPASPESPLSTNTIFDVTLDSRALPLYNTSVPPFKSSGTWEPLQYWTITNTAGNPVYVEKLTNCSFKAVTSGVFTVSTSFRYVYGGTHAPYAVGLRVFSGGASKAEQIPYQISWAYGFSLSTAFTMTSGQVFQVELKSPDGGFLYNSKCTVGWTRGN